MYVFCTTNLCVTILHAIVLTALVPHASSVVHSNPRALYTVMIMPAASPSRRLRLVNRMARPIVKIIKQITQKLAAYSCLGGHADGKHDIELPRDHRFVPADDVTISRVTSSASSDEARLAELLEDLHAQLTAEEDAPTTVEEAVEEAADGVDDDAVSYASTPRFWWDTDDEEPQDVC